MTRFFNPHIRHVRRTLFDFLLWAIGYYREAPAPDPTSFTYPNPTAPIDSSLPRLQWIGHSTFLIQCEGISLLTDPIWSLRCSPFPYLGPKRRLSPPLALEALPKIDCVLISHNHYDHLDQPTVLKLKRLFPEILWIIPHGLKKWFLRRGINRVIELGWWQKYEWQIGSFAIEITAVPAQHFSGRAFFDKNGTLWCGWAVSCKKEGKKWKNFYFVGDTGYNPYDFVEIGRVFDGFDLSLIPIGTYVPHAFMEPVHIDPEKAVRIHKEVGSQLSVAMHHQTFRLSEEPLKRPPYDLYLAISEQALDPLHFRVLDVGQELNW